MSACWFCSFGKEFYLVLRPNCDLSKSKCLHMWVYVYLCVCVCNYAYVFYFNFVFYFILVGNNQRRRVLHNNYERQSNETDLLLYPFPA